MQLHNLETKVNEKNVEKIASRMLQGWNRIHNFSYSTKGRIWVVWKPNHFTVKVVSMSAQHILWKVCSLLEMQSFFITYVYEENQEGLRLSLWQTLRDISSNMEDAWGVLGDFNLVLYNGDRIGENAI